jgi:hypothetical protein
MHNFDAQGFRLVIAVMMVGMSTSAAHAYLDPGTGSIILQLLLGGVAGLALTCKLYWQKLLSLVGAEKQAKESPGNSWPRRSPSRCPSGPRRAAS